MTPIGKGTSSRKTAIKWNREQLRHWVSARASRTKQDLLAIGSPAGNPISSGMVSQSAWHSSRCRYDIDIDVAVVLTGESYQRTVGRKLRISFHTSARRQSRRCAAFPADYPQIAGVDENDLTSAQRRLLKQRRFDGLCLADARESEQESRSGGVSFSFQILSTKIQEGLSKPTQMIYLWDLYCNQPHFASEG